MLNYDDVKNKESTFIAMTSLTVSEFEELCVEFKAALEEQDKREKRDPSKGGRPSKLKTPEDKLFFILFYLKTYPLQEVIAHLFGMAQGQANQWIHRLSAVLKIALERSNDLPARLSGEMLDRLGKEAPQGFAIDGTERRINRPKDDEEQRKKYSGKKNSYSQKQSNYWNN